MRTYSILVLATTILAILAHQCAMAKQEKSLPPPPPMPEGRQLQDYRGAEYQPIRIKFYKYNFDASDSLLDKIEEKIITPVTTWYQNVLSIKPVNGNLIMTENTCQDLQVPDDDKTIGVEADVIIYVTVGYENTATLGWGEVCALTPDSYPMAGRLHLESAAFVDASYEDLLANSIREVAHILAFNPFLYHYFLNQPVTDLYTNRGKTVAGIVTPTVVAKARESFGCQAMLGVELESQGGDGTSGKFWEKRIMANDFMVAGGDIQDVIYSDITMALFEDSGWYQVDYTYTTGIVWGRD